MNVYRLLFGDIAARLGWRFIAIIPLMALVGLTEGTSVALLLPLLSRIGVGAATNQSFASVTLENILTALGATDVVRILAVIVVVATAQAALYISLSWWTSRLGRRYQSQRQSELFRAFVRARWSFLTARKAGELTNVIVTESERLGIAFATGLSILSTVAVMAVYLVLALTIAWQITTALAIFALVTGLLMLRLYRRSYAIGQALGPLNAELQSMLSEQFAGIKIVKATAGEERAAAWLDPLVRKIERANTLISFTPLAVRGVLEFLALVGLAVMLVLGNQGMGVALGNVLVVLALFARLFPRITTLQAQLHYFNGYVHAIEVINALQTAAEAEAERQDATADNLRIDLPATLSVQNLQVAFDERKALDNVSLAFPMPGMLAIVGGSGAGKSTLVHAMLGLIEPSAGSIKLGPYDLASTPLGAWRRAIGYVPQETILFHASVWDNLTLADPSATVAEVETAARRAHAHEFIQAMPQGYKTIIGDQGVRMSGGQRQRLAIARALLTNPTLLLLDEAMSALDAESEAELLQTLEELRGQMGIMIIAHRLAAVRSADRICVFEAGRIVESGTWDDLMARKSRLYALAEAQSRGHESFADTSPAHLTAEAAP